MPAPETRLGRAVLDTNVLVAAGFRPRSAPGRLAVAVRQGHLVGIWNEATRAEAARILGRIPPLRGRDIAGLFAEAGRLGVALEPGGYPLIPGGMDRVFAALAAAADAPLVTADGPLTVGARAHGVTVLSPAEAVRRLL